jgi:hypothetical protein
LFINKQNRKISWFFSDKLKHNPPTKPVEDFNSDDDEVTDEEDLESQERHGWLESGKPPPQDPPKSNEAGPSDYQGEKRDSGDTTVLEDVVSTESEISQIQNRDIQYHESMPKLSNTILNTNFVEAIPAPTKSFDSLISEVFSLVDSSNVSTSVPLSQK